ncbi:uncharacterized protein N0V89_009403 [Didymosphaeria variabile]|uniref:Uncharacterized protein n=1 Tax=Didymosphaeria variabile TaxID=1932322 RepID=A0A9W8XDB2_9PLEO|nr:uncharacterized protein N0V89_009403 [Didymosphaeria variabile]KAJ4348031.1 hypothetical protein N0V89_009403 [Didymosphaeria variabile]
MAVSSSSSGSHGSQGSSVGVGVCGLLDVRDGLVKNVLGVGRDEDDGGGRVGLEVGGGGGVGLDVGGNVDLEVGDRGGEGLDVGGNEGVGLDVGGPGGVGIDVGLMGVVGTGLDDETDGMDLEDEDKGGIGLGKEMGGMGRVVGIGGNIVVLKTGGEGLAVGMLSDGKLRVGRLNVGSGNDDTEGIGPEDTAGAGREGEMGALGLDVGNGGTTVELRTDDEGMTVGRLNVGRLNDGRLGVGVPNVGNGLDDETGGKGLVVGNGGTTVVLKTGGEGLTVGTLSEGRLNDGKLSEGRLNVGKLSDGRLNDGKLSDGRLNDGKLSVGRLSVGIGLEDEVAIDGASVELIAGSEGLTVGAVSVGKLVELRTGGSCGGLKVGSVNVGSGARDVTGRVAEGRVVEFNAGVVGIPIGTLDDGSDKLGGNIGEIEGKDVREMFTLGSGSVNEGRAVGSDKDGSDNDGSDRDGNDRDGNDKDGNDKEGSDKDGRDKVGSGNVVGLEDKLDVEIERETLTLDTGGRVGRTVGRVMIGDEVTETVGSGTKELLDGPPKLREPEAESVVTLPPVVGRGMPEGRLHVRFCAAATLNKPSNVKEVSTSMVVCSSEVERPQN